MLKKVTSVLLALSFFVLVVSGIIMMVNKRMSFELRMTPFHQFFGIVMIITGIIHLIINFKSIASYLKTKPVGVIFGSTLILALVLWVIAVNTKQPDRGPQSRKYHGEVESRNQTSE